MGTSLSITHAYDFADGRISFGDSDHEISDIRTRDGEAETRQVAFPDPVLPRRRPICKFGWAHDGPVESTLPKNVLHSRCIGDRIAEEQPTQKVRRRDDGVLEQECHRLDHHAPDSDF